MTNREPKVPAERAGTGLSDAECDAIIEPIDFSLRAAGYSLYRALIRAGYAAASGPPRKPIAWGCPDELHHEDRCMSIPVYAAAPPAASARGEERDWPRVYGVSRTSDNNRALLVVFAQEPSDDALRAVHEALRHAAPVPAAAIAELCRKHGGDGMSATCPECDDPLAASAQGEERK